MKNIFQKLIVAGLLLLTANSVMGMDNDVKIGESADYGKYLTDSRGMTLYWYVKDVVGKSNCSDEFCLSRWAVYYRENIVAPSGIEAKDFGEIKRVDGKKQTTFRGYPLYYSVNDLDPGDVNRQRGDNVFGRIIAPDDFPPKQKSDKK